MKCAVTDSAMLRLGLLESKLGPRNIMTRLNFHSVFSETWLLGTVL